MAEIQLQNQTSGATTTPSAGNSTLFFQTSDGKPYWKDSTGTSNAIAATLSTVTSGSIVNVKDFGAIGNNVADDTTAIQNAVNSLTTGGIVFFPVGTYKVSSTITVNNAHVTLEGEARYNTTIQTTSTTADIITLNQYYQKVKGLTIMGTVASAQVTSRTAGAGVNMSSVAGAYGEIYDCTFTYQWNAILMANQLSVVDECEIRYFANSGIVVNHNSDHQIARVTMDNNVGALPSGSGIDVQVTASLLINSCNIIHSNFALNLSPATGVTVPSVKAVNCFFDTSAIGLRMAGAGSVFRSEFTNCWFSSMTTAGILMAPSTANGVDGITFVNCDIYNNVGGTTNGVSVTTANVGKWKMIGCNIAGWTNGINIVGGTSHFPVISNCTIGAVSAFTVNGTGIVVTTGSYKGLIIQGNDCRDNTAVLSLGTVTPTNAADFRILDNSGINPRGTVTTPAVPASTVVATNTTGFKVMVLLKSGATAPTVFNVNGVSTVLPLASQIVTLPLEPGGTISATYTVAFTWTWVGN